MSPSADVTCVKRSHDDEFLVLGTDGVWDVLSNQVRENKRELNVELGLSVVVGPCEV